MARPRKLPPQRVTEQGGVVFAKETPEDVLVAELEAQQAKDDAKAAKKRAPKKVELPPTERELEAHLPKGEDATFESKGDLLEIWQRRMVNPTAREDKGIRLKLPGQHLRWINLSNNGRYQRARYSEGWVPVRKVELTDEREIFGSSYTTEGYVCRGEKQSEMLMRIPEAVWKQIQSRKFAAIEKSNKQLKDSMKSAGAAHFGNKYNNNKGDEIADTIDNFKGDISFGKERVEADQDILQNDLAPAE